MNPGDLITIRQAFAAMHRFLEMHWERTHGDDVGADARLTLKNE
jgi:hypothetical protein